MADEADMAELQCRSFLEEAISQRKQSQSGQYLQRKGANGEVLCRLCEEPIPLARLLAVPDAALCVDCASNLENA